MVKRFGTALFMALTLSIAIPAHTHELPDGQAERAIQVTVWPDRIEVEYRFGMSEATMREALAKQGVQPASELSALEAQFLATFSVLVPQQLTMRYGNEVLQPQQVESELIYQHHFPFACTLTYPLQSLGRGSPVVLDDRNWREWPGYCRSALKARGDVTVTKANVPPVLVRAERIALPSFASSNDPALTIEAVVRDPNAPEPVAADAPQLYHKAERHSRTDRPLPRRYVLIGILLIALVTLPLVFMRERGAKKR